MTATWNGSVAQYESVQLEPLDVVEGTTYQVTMTGSGDPDLYVRFGLQPTKNAWHCRPYKTGPNEQCSLTVPAEEKQVFMMVRGYKAGQFNVVANYTTP